MKKYSAYFFRLLLLFHNKGSRDISAREPAFFIQMFSDVACIPTLNKKRNSSCVRTFSRKVAHAAACNSDPESSVGVDSNRHYVPGCEPVVTAEGHEPVVVVVVAHSSG